MTIPSPTAVRRSTKTVVRKTTIRTKASALGMRGRSRNPRKSMIPHPTVIKMPASTARGTYCTNTPSPSRIANRNRACIMPLNWVRPPLFTLTTVRMVAPAPAMPANEPASKLPIPCPMSSWLLLWWVLVILSATTEVSSVSIDPSPARVSPGMMALMIVCSQLIPSRWILSCRKKGKGSPAGILPMVRWVSMFKNSDMMVMAIKATRVAGTLRVIFGKKAMRRMVPIPSMSTGHTMPSDMAWGNPASISMTATGDFLPMRG